MPFGVTLPDNIGETQSTAPDTGAPSGAPEGAAPSPDTISPKGTSTETPKGADALTDLDKLERFRFQGREWSRKDLERAYLRQEDYSRKTQELAETRKYTDNFAADLRTVIKDRSRLEEFKRLYPREYVERAEEILSTLPGSRPPETQQTGNVDPAFREDIEGIKREFNQLKQEREAQAIEQIQSWLDNQFDTLGKKYPNARQKEVMADAEVAARNCTKVTAEVLEKLFKASDAEISGAWEAKYKEKVNKQLSAGKQARDIGPGGGVPGEAPRTPKTFKEARELMIEDMKAQGRR